MPCLESVFQRKLEQSRVEYFPWRTEVGVRERDAARAASDERERVRLNLGGNRILVPAWRRTAEVGGGVNRVHFVDVGPIEQVEGVDRQVQFLLLAELE